MGAQGRDPEVDEVGGPGQLERRERAADVARSVETPSAAATAQPRMPVQMPTDVAKPADRP